MQRLHSNQPALLETQLAEESARLRKEAQGTPPGIDRERLMRRARQAETGSLPERMAALARIATANVRPMPPALAGRLFRRRQ
jgi:hypothetical protein